MSEELKARSRSFIEGVYNQRNLDLIEGFVTADGQRHHPAWYHNLIANPLATVSFAGRRKRVRARLATGEERRRLWAMGTEIYPAWNIYRERAASREIGIVVLEDEAAGSVPPIA